MESANAHTRRRSARWARKSAICSKNASPATRRSPSRRSPKISSSSSKAVIDDLLNLGPVYGLLAASPWLAKIGLSQPVSPTSPAPPLRKTPRSRSPPFPPRSPRSPVTPPSPFSQQTKILYSAPSPSRTRRLPPAALSKVAPRPPPSLRGALFDDGESLRRASFRMRHKLRIATVSYVSAEAFISDPPPIPADFSLLEIQLGGTSGLDLFIRLQNLPPRAPLQREHRRLSSFFLPPARHHFSTSSPVRQLRRLPHQGRTRRGRHRRDPRSRRTPPNRLSLFLIPLTRSIP